MKNDLENATIKALTEGLHLNKSKVVEAKDSNNWFGVEGAKYISRGSWSDPQVSYKGYLYNYWDISEFVYNCMVEDYQEEGKELPAENTKEYEDLFNKYMYDEVPNAFIDLYPQELDPQVMEYLENGTISNGVVDLIKNASKISAAMTFEGLLNRLNSLKELTNIPEDKIDEAIKVTQEVADSVDYEDSFDEDERYEEVLPQIEDILSNMDGLFENKKVTETVDEDKTKIIFRKDKEDGDIIAVFAEDIQSNNMIGCYAHMGQHSTMSLDYYNKGTTPATPEEYADLKRELESIGYNVEVVNKLNENKRVTEAQVVEPSNEAEKIAEVHFSKEDFEKFVGLGKEEQFKKIFAYLTEAEYEFCTDDMVKGYEKGENTYEDVTDCIDVTIKELKSLEKDYPEKKGEITKGIEKFETAKKGISKKTEANEIDKSKYPDPTGDIEEYSLRNDRENPVWIVGSVVCNGKQYSISGKVYLESSKFGIDNGPISKLWIKDMEKSKVIVNYDRGWDVKPTDENKDLYEAVMKLLVDYREKNPYEVTESKKVKTESDTINMEDDISETFNPSYKAFENNFGKIYIVEDKYDKLYKVYKENKLNLDDYIYYADNKDQIIGFLDGAIKANNGIFNK